MKAMSVNQACERIGVHRTKAYRLIREGRLPARKLDGRTIIMESDVATFIDSLPEMSSSATLEQQLRMLAVDHLQRNECIPRRALDGFVDDVRRTGGLMSALYPRESTAALAIHFIESVAQDMRDLASDEQSDGGGQQQAAQPGHSDGAPADNLRGGASITLPVGHEGHASPRNPNDTGGGRLVSAARHINIAPSRVTTIRELRAEGAYAESVFDGLLLRDGTPLGDLRWSQLDRFIKDNTREAALLRLVRDFAVPADPNARVRDVIRPDVMKRLVERSREIADAN